jgi:hypothetical protein
MSVSELNERLTSAFGFSSGEPYENEAGRLSPRQKQLLAEARRLRALGFRLGWLVFLGLGGLWLVITFWHGLFDWRDLSSASPYISAVLGAVVALIGVCLVVGALKGGDLRRGRISRVEGPVEVKVEEYEKPKVPDEFFQVHSVTVGGVKFTVEPNQAQAFEDGARYRIYYVRYSPPIILSAEAL